MVMIILGVIMIAFGLYDYKNPNSKLLRIFNLGPKNDTDKEEVRSNGSVGIFGGIMFISIGIIAIFLKS
ncbi:hypothetical protein G8C92_28820 [Paenibacillus donghaensis]|uniref:hypothetical protein n=1 Tax=Paenibacillus donghaensis TaxID=414771 RepID=UPI0018836F8A|nr:hypothetical protein [Paenibacillus donghaensis]MBE9918008.1 hypothetical protein [Paenibacillus donghaensis]